MTESEGFMPAFLKDLNDEMLEDFQQAQLQQSPNEEQNKDEEDGQTTLKAISSNENSLGALTKLFVAAIKREPAQVFDITKMAQLLGIHKRRIYDITNVLEGIGFITKIEKNKMKWVGGTSDPQMSEELNALNQEIQHYEEKNRQLQNDIKGLTDRILLQSKSNPHLNFLTKADLEKILNKIGQTQMLCYEGTQGTFIETSFDPETDCCEVSINSPSHWKGSVFSMFNSTDNRTDYDKVEDHRQQLIPHDSSVKKQSDETAKIQPACPITETNPKGQKDDSEKIKWMTETETKREQRSVPDSKKSASKLKKSRNLSQAKLKRSNIKSKRDRIRVKEQRESFLSE